MSWPKLIVLVIAIASIGGHLKAFSEKPLCNTSIERLK